MNLQGKKIVILAEKLYEELELWYPLLRLREAGANVVVTSRPNLEACHGKYGYPLQIDVPVTELDSSSVDAVVIPGGYAPDHLRRYPVIIDFVREVYERNGVVAFICHGGWVAISAGILRGKRATSFFAIKDDMINAGAIWEDSSVVRDGNLISSRTPDDLPSFCQCLIEALQSNSHWPTVSG